MRYLYIQLKDFKEGKRVNALMTPMVETLSRQDMINIANFLRSAAGEAIPVQSGRGQDQAWQSQSG